MAGLCRNNNAMNIQNHFVYSVDMTNRLQAIVSQHLDAVFNNDHGASPINPKSCLSAFINQFCTLCTRCTQYDTDSDDELGQLFHDINANIPYPTLASLFLSFMNDFRNKDSLSGFIDAIASTKPQLPVEAAIIETINQNPNTAPLLLAAIGEYCNALIQHNALELE